MTEADRKRQFLACLSDPSRFSMVTTLAAGPRCVTELAGLVGLSQSCTTRHLQALLREGIVSGERQGKKVVYTLRAPNEDLHPVLRWACGSLGTAATASHAMDAPRPSRPRTRQRSAGSAAATAGIEVTDALVVGFDSSWNSSDAGSAEDPVGLRAMAPAEVPEASESAPAPLQDEEPADASSPQTRPGPRAATEDLDDFLL